MCILTGCLPLSWLCSFWLATLDKVVNTLESLVHPSVRRRGWDRSTFKALLP